MGFQGLFLHESTILKMQVVLREQLSLDPGDGRIAGGLQIRSGATTHQLWVPLCALALSGPWRADWSLSLAAEVFHEPGQGSQICFSGLWKAEDNVFSQEGDHIKII